MRKNLKKDFPSFTDIKKKHSSHAITADVSIAETGHAAEFFLSDGVIVTGVSTGTEADLDEGLKTLNLALIAKDSSTKNRLIRIN